jgi:hypothetical protein
MVGIKDIQFGLGSRTGYKTDIIKFGANQGTAQLKHHCSISIP